jgi:hypothetical protein
VDSEAAQYWDSGAERNPSGPAELTAVVNEVREFTRASGAAIALISSRPGELECRARSGLTAPEIGRSVIVEDSLTALCIRTGKQLRCDNAEADQRVRAAALFDLGVRSLVITPIRQQNCIVGALAVFANAPHGFSTAHLARLSAAAHEVAEILRKTQLTERKTSDNVLSFPASGADVAKGAADSGPDRAVPSEKPLLQEASATAIASLARFPTFEGVGPARRILAPSKVLLFAGVAFLMIGAAIWAVLAFSRPALHAAKRIESNEKIAAPTSEIDAAIPDIPSISPQVPGRQAVLSIEPSAPAPRQGVSFVLNVVFSHARNISAVPMQINYDPKVLRFVDLSVGGFFSKAGQKAIILHRDDPTSGTLKIDAQLPPGASPISGDGTVCQLVFVALEKGPGAISVAATARNSHDELVNVVGSRVAVNVN